MSKRKSSIVVREIATNDDAVFVFMDALQVGSVREIDGVTRIEQLHAPEYAVHIDPRYDKQGVISEILALNAETSVPSVFNE